MGIIYKNIIPLNAIQSEYKRKCKKSYVPIKRKVYKLEIMENMLLIKEQLNQRTLKECVNINVVIEP